MSVYSTPIILIVDDDPLVLEATASQIGMWGYRAVACCSSMDALEAFRKGGIDLVVSDIKMPGMSGIELLRMIRGLNADIPVILMTAYAEVEIAIDAVRRGATDYILKPFKPEYLRQSIAKGIRYGKLIQTEKKYVEILEEKVRETDENLKAAGYIQRCLLPDSFPQLVSFDFAWQFLPCERIGGDLYNIFWLDETRLGIYVFDVSGHGVPAAMVATSVAQALDPFCGRLLKYSIDAPPHYELVSPAGVLAGLDRNFPIERFDKFFTICYLILDVARGEVKYSNAALPLPLLLRADGRVETLGKGGTIIGLGEGAVFEEGTVCMRNGDRLFLYTDGIIEHFDSGGELFGSQRLVRELKKRSAGETLQATCDRVLRAVLSFGGDQRPADDITLLAIECRQPAEN